MDRTLWATVVALLLLFTVFELTPVDLWIQDLLFDFPTGTWMIDADAFWPGVFAYTGPKLLLIIFSVGLIVIASGPDRWRRRVLPWTMGRACLWVVIATVATGPALIALGKSTTNVFCPSQIRRYGGNAPYVLVCQAYPAGDRPAKRGRCFPAGHASGGYALMSLAGLVASRRGQKIGLLIGVALGSWMGGYQMLKGAHYLSHTVVTALAMWIIFLLWRRVFRVTGNITGAAGMNEN